MTTDIEHHGIVRLLPTAMRPYAVLMRLDRPIGWWLLLLPAWWAILLSHAPVDADTVRMMALFLIGAVVMRGAGCVVNDLWDRDLDRLVARTKDRPIASGAVSVPSALIFTAGLCLVGLWVLLQLPVFAIALGMASIPFIIAYPLMKRITWWPQLFLGLTFNFGALIGWATMTGALEWPALTLYAAGIFWTLAYDTIYACMDKSDDARQGIKSTARRFGRHVKVWVCGFYVISFALLALSVLLARAPYYLAAAMLVPLALAHYWLWAWEAESQAQSLRLFKRQRDIGLLVCLILLFCSL